MGKKDLTGKEFFADKERFAELMNAFFYQGEKKIKAQELEQATRLYPAFHGKGEMSRDVFMKDTLRNICYGLELESESDYSMPERVMVYDACEFESQIREMARRHEKELLQTERFRHLKEETAWAIAVHINRKRLIPKLRREESDMGNAIDEIFEDGKMEGRLEGREEGRKIIIRNMLQEGMDREFICRVTGCSPQEVASAIE